MMTSDRKTPDSAFVWVWLPGETEPVVAGRITMDGGRYIFNYGASYLERKNAIPLYDPELPLKRGRIDPLPNMEMASCLRDGSPDAWGRRVIINRLVGPKAAGQGAGELNELTYLLESGSDRIGALDFQRSASEYVPRTAVQASYQELLEAADRVEKGLPSDTGARPGDPSRHIDRGGAAEVADR
jgi:serine/threonine-protein kinase HipA